jgi:hypothetical protein
LEVDILTAGCLVVNKDQLDKIDCFVTGENVSSADAAAI